MIPLFTKHPKRILFVLLAATVFVTGVSVFLIKKPVVQISTFEECVKAGYPVAESYPPQCRTEYGTIFTQDIGNELELIDVIRISQPRPNSTVANPFVITGEAKGTWFFEGSFVVKLFDARGKEMGRAIAQAYGEWMTEEFVGFSTELTFSEPSTPNGTLILEKENPSGLPENDNALRIPLAFTQSERK